MSSAPFSSLDASLASLSLDTGDRKTPLLLKIVIAPPAGREQLPPSPAAKQTLKERDSTSTPPKTALPSTQPFCQRGLAARVVRVHPDTSRRCRCLFSRFVAVERSSSSSAIFRQQLDELVDHGCLVFGHALDAAPDTPLPATAIIRPLPNNLPLARSVRVETVPGLCASDGFLVRMLRAVISDELELLPLPVSPAAAFEFAVRYLGVSYLVRVVDVAPHPEVLLDAAAFSPTHTKLVLSICGDGSAGDSESPALEVARPGTALVPEFVGFSSIRQMLVERFATSAATAAGKSPFPDGSADPPRLLIGGAPGSGKTHLARYFVSAILRRQPMYVNCTALLRPHFGETERLIFLHFSLASDADAVLVLDNLDAVLTSAPSCRVALVSALDKFAKTVAVVATCASVDAVDESVRARGRLNFDLELLAPSAEDRCLILKSLLARELLSGSDATAATGIPSEEEVEAIARRYGHGFLPCDLLSVIAEFTFSRNLSLAFARTKPSALREIHLEVPTVRWSDIGGQRAVKQSLQEAVSWPLLYAEQFRRLGIRPLRGVLMYGPPGCSKTMLAKAIATESGLNFIAVKGPELLGKYVGDSEAAVRQVFRRARAAAPCVVFFDEMDALAPSRSAAAGNQSQTNERVLAQLLSEMDGITELKDVVVIAATNRPDLLDPSLMRPGRFDRHVYVPLPDAETRQAIWDLQLKKIPFRPGSDASSGAGPSDAATQLADATAGYSGAEIVGVCREACLAALTADMDAESISMQILLETIRQTRPRIPPEMIEFYEQWASCNASATAPRLG